MAEEEHGLGSDLGCSPLRFDQASLLSVSPKLAHIQSNSLDL